MKKEKLFSKWCWDNWSSIHTYKKVNLNLNLILYIKLYTKWITDISRTQKTKKLLEQKKDFVIGLGEELLNTTIYKRKNINKLDSSQFQISALLFTRCRTWDKYFSGKKFSHLFKKKKTLFIKIKNLCSQKVLLREWKDRLQTGEKILANHIFNKRLYVSRTYKNLSKFHSKKKKNYKMSKTWTYTSPKRIYR